MKFRIQFTLATLILPVLALAAASTAQQYDMKLFSGMRWRAIGPFRGGRTRAAAGVPTQPHVFYVGVCNGGVWKTTDAGRTWDPIFDDEPTGSIGAIAVSLSDPNIIRSPTLQKPSNTCNETTAKAGHCDKPAVAATAE